jgi:hypothetical protein
MATFPSLTPSSRTFTPGDRPTTAITTFGGGEERTRNSNCIVGQSLKLAFQGITEAQALLIVAHYNGQQGGYQSFAIPNAVLSGLSSPSEITPSGYAWVYAARPEVTDAPLYRDVTVELLMVRI